MESLGLPYQYKSSLRRGASPAEILAVINDAALDGHQGAVNFLKGVRDQVMESSGVAGWADYATLKEFTKFANQGLYSAIGQTEIKNYIDQYSMNDALNKEKERREAARKAAEASEQELAAIKLSGVSYLQASGDLGRYQRALAGLKGGQQGISAAVFGKHGTVNPITVYNAADAAMSNAERRIRQTYKPQIRRAEDEAAYEVGYGAGKEEVDRLEREMSSAITAARTKAYQDTLKKYGVTKGITKDQYDALQAIGYNGKTPMLNYSQLTDPLNALAQQRSYYSTNMSGYDIPDQKIRSELGNWESNGTFSKAVYKLNANGTQGKAVSYDDLKLKSDSDIKGRQVTGIYYSAFTPDKIIVQIGDSGDRYLMDPNVLGTEVATLIGQTQNIL